MSYSDLIEDKIIKISERLVLQNPDIENPRFYAIKLLENDPEIIESISVDVSDIVDRSYETDIINQKYDFIEKIIEEVLVNKEERANLQIKLIVCLPIESLDFLSFRHNGTCIFANIYFG